MCIGNQQSMAGKELYLYFGYVTETLLFKSKFLIPVESTLPPLQITCPNTLAYTCIIPYFTSSSPKLTIVEIDAVMIALAADNSLSIISTKHRGQDNFISKIGGKHACMQTNSPLRNF